MAEEWLPVVGYENRYEVSNLGRVRSRDRLVTSTNGRTYRRQGRVLSPFLTGSREGNKYLKVALYRGPDRQQAAVHVLVLEAFIGVRQLGHVGCHNDGNNQNNDLTNLRWDTPRENNLDTIRHGKHPNASLTHCKWGHEFTPENTYIAPGDTRRNCRECQKVRVRQCWLRTKAKPK